MLILIALLGLIFGSFANAVVWRIHEQKSISEGRSMCPNCEHQLSALDLVPVVSWLMLGAKCRYCKKPISPQYPAVELLTAALFALTYYQLRPSSPHAWAELAVWLYLITVLVILSVYDLRWMLLPDVVLLPAIVITAVSAFVLGWGNGYGWPQLAAGIGAGAVFLGLAAVSGGRWMGGGDIKLAVLMGVALGPSKLLVAMLIGFNTAAVVGIALIALRVKKRSDHIPFGPFLAGGTVVAMLWGADIIRWYLHLSGVV